MFEIKICGVKRLTDIDAVARAASRYDVKAAIGLNFFRPSVRFTDPDDSSTRALSDHAADLGLVRVGVFVNQDSDQMQRTAEAVGLDMIQMHGDEPLATAKQLIANSRVVMRAIKLTTVDLSAKQIHEQTAAWLDVGCSVLLDADAGAAHGGSGKTLDWTAVGQWADEHRAGDHRNDSWTLAGGLTPENLARAVSLSKASSVDTASGAEEQRGVKSPQRIEQFFDAMTTR